MIRAWGAGQGGFPASGRTAGRLSCGEARGGALGSARQCSWGGVSRTVLLAIALGLTGCMDLPPSALPQTRVLPSARVASRVNQAIARVEARLQAERDRRDNKAETLRDRSAGWFEDAIGGGEYGEGGALLDRAAPGEMPDDSPPETLGDRPTEGDNPAENPLPETIPIARLHRRPGAAIAGRVVGVIDNEFILRDDTGEVVVDGGPSWWHDLELAVGERVTVVGHFDDYDFDAYRIVRHGGEDLSIRDETEPPPWAEWDGED